jgi:hypothetical protein
MPDLLEEVKEIRQQLHAFQVLLEVADSRRSAAWFRDPERSAMVERLVKDGWLEAARPPIHFRLTDAGAQLMANVRAKVATEGRTDWTRVRDVDFARL